MESKINEIHADDKTVRDVLDKIKYKIDFFQREYNWKRKQIEQLLDDLTTKFFANYDESHERKEVQKYARYYLGPIVLSVKGSERSIIDGQQRLTSLTLLLIYLNNLMKDKNVTAPINDLIFSEKYSEKSFNLQIPDRKACIEALYNNKEFDATEKSDSVRNILDRYGDIEELFPDELKEKAASYFIDWLIDNVIFVEIITYSDEDAYNIFETMNDRGLNLTSTEMLKGFILSNLDTIEQKEELNEIWKKNIQDLGKIHQGEDLEFFKAFLRAKYAETIRPGKKGAANEDFEKIGTRFHSWVKDNKNKVGLGNKNEFYGFVTNYFDFYVKLYIKIYTASDEIKKDLESIYYIGERGLASSIYFPLLMSPINLDDGRKTINKKLALVSKFLEMFIVFRSVNYRNYSHSSIRYTMYTLVKEIRNKPISELAKILKEKVLTFEEDLSKFDELRMHGQNGRFIHFLLARITQHIEKKSKIPSSFEDYTTRDIEKPFQVEHIWADKFEEHKDEFEQTEDFKEWRNAIGALLLLPEGFNQSYGALPYRSKLPHYYGQNLLAKTLSPKCYEHNPDFLRYKEQSGFLFKSHPQFKKKDIEERQELYQKICEEIYNIEIFDEIVENE